MYTCIQLGNVLCTNQKYVSTMRSKIWVSFLLIRIFSITLNYFYLPIIFTWKMHLPMVSSDLRNLKVNEMLNGPVGREWQNWWRQCAVTFYLRQKHAQRVEKKKLKISDVVIKESRAKSNLSVLLSHLCGSFS